MEYKVYQLDIIKNNHRKFVRQINCIYKQIKKEFKSSDTTWVYDKYNIFSKSSASLLFYKLYKKLNYCIRDYVKDDKPLWMQSWLNYHNSQNLALSLGEKQGFHSHNAKYHGYISIDPQNTITIFRNGLEIPNKIGQLYIGPGSNSGLKPPPEGPWDHYVKVLTPLSKPRITIAFDIIDKGEPYEWLGGTNIWFPLL